MDILAVLGVSWQQWGMLAAAAWLFAVVCFAGAYWPRSRHRVRRGTIVELPVPTGAGGRPQRDDPRRAA